MTCAVDGGEGQAKQTGMLKLAAAMCEWAPYLVPFPCVPLSCVPPPRAQVLLLYTPYCTLQIDLRPVWPGYSVVGGVWVRKLFALCSRGALASPDFYHRARETVFNLLVVCVFVLHVLSVCVWERVCVCECFVRYYVLACVCEYVCVRPCSCASVSSWLMRRATP